MGKLRQMLTLFLPLLLLTVLAGPANAALQAVGPTDAATTLPTWYQDPTDLALQLCLDQNGFCILTPDFDPNGAALRVPPQPAGTPPVPITYPISDATFPDESFYFIADAAIPNIGGNPQESANLRMAMEAAFLTGVVPNQGITFLRVNLQQIRGALPANTTYTVTYPFGSFQFTTDGQGNASAQGGAAYRAEDPIAPSPGVYFPPEMQGGTLTRIGPFLKRAAGLIVDPVSGHTYIGDAATPVPVTGGTNGNVFRITGTDIGGPGVNSVETDLFVIAGRVFTGAIARPLTIDRSTYARDAAGGQVDIFVTSLANATITISGNGIPTTVMTPNATNATKYFAHIPFTGSTIPSNVIITNSLDLVAPVPHPVTLVDEVIISEAIFNPINNAVTIKAVTRDKTLPLTSLTGVGFALPNTFDANGTLVKTLTTTPPANVTVQSTNGGSDTIPISVTIPPPPPVAVDDNAATVKNSAVVISVLANDTADGGINPATVAVVATPASGATAVANANGKVTYTPTAAFTGTETFTYNYKDFYSQTSNTATVTVTVHGPPVAGDDTASTAVNSLVNINVISNDTASNGSINSATVNIVSPATCGTTAIQTNGTVDFIAPANPGVCSFSYVVNDTFAPPATSNVATVTVTIIPPPPPAAATGVAVTTNLVSPEAAQGTQITFIGSGSGGSGSYEYSYWLFDGTSWAETRPYSTTNNWTWDTTGLATGVNYSIAVNVRSVGSTALFEAVAYRPVKLNPTAISLMVTANTPSPQLPGVPVTFSAAASGSSGNYAYQFYLFDGTNWNLVQDYSSIPTWTWSSTGLPAGNYLIGVNVLNSSLVGTYANAYFSYTLTSPVASVTVISDQPSPHSAGTPVIFAASGVGGSGTYEYEFSFFDGTTWSLVKPYSGTSAWTLPDATAAGSYTIGVNVRNAGASNASDATIFVPYVVQ